MAFSPLEHSVPLSPPPCVTPFLSVKLNLTPQLVSPPDFPNVTPRAEAASQGHGRVRDAPRRPLTAPRGLWQSPGRQGDSEEGRSEEASLGLAISGCVFGGQMGRLTERRGRRREQR